MTQKFIGTNQGLMFYNWIQILLTYRKNFARNEEYSTETITKKNSHLEKLHKARGTHFIPVLNNVSSGEK